MSNVVPVRIMAAYPLFGDVDGKAWMHEILKQDQSNRLISAYSVGPVGVSAATGVQTVDFSVTAEMDVSGNKAEIKRRAATFLNEIILHDSDVIVHSVSTPI